MMNIQETSARSIEAINFFMETAMKIARSLFLSGGKTNQKNVFGSIEKFILVISRSNVGRGKRNRSDRV